MPAPRKIASRRKALRPAGNAKPANRLLAASKLSDAKVRSVICCYADGRSPAEAMARTGLSYVTIYRLYRYIRDRLAHYDIALTKDKFIDYINESDEEGREHFDWDVFEAFIAKALGRHRHIRARNRAAYTAEAILRFENIYTPRQLYALIMLTIRVGGPLNRPPTPGRDWLVLAEILRLGLLRMRSTIRSSPTDKHFTWMLPGLEAFEHNADRMIDAVAEHMVAVRRAGEKHERES